MFERTGDKISHEHLRSWVGQEYKPYDLLFGSDRISCLTSSGEIGLEKKEESGDFNFFLLLKTLSTSHAPSQLITRAGLTRKLFLLSFSFFSLSFNEGGF